MPWFCFYTSKISPKKTRLWDCFVKYFGIILVAIRANLCLPFSFLTQITQNAALYQQISCIVTQDKKINFFGSRRLVVPQQQQSLNSFPPPSSSYGNDVIQVHLLWRNLFVGGSKVLITLQRRILNVTDKVHRMIKSDILFSDWSLS